MKFLDTVARAGRSLKNAKARTLLTSLAIGVGAFTITLSLAAGQGGRAYTDQIVSANTDVRELVVTKKQPEASTGPKKYEASTVSSGAVTGPLGGSGSSQVNFLNEVDIVNIKNVEHVVSVSPNYAPKATYITAEGADKYIVESISTFSPSVQLEYAAGDFEGDLKGDEIILTEEFASALGFKTPQDAVGKTVTIRADKLSSPVTAPENELFTYTVKAVSSKSGFAFRAQGSLLVSNTAAEALYEYINSGTRAYGNFLLASVQVDDAANAAGVKDVLNSKGYEAQTAADILGTVNTFINVLQGILIGFGALAVLTSVFGIINTQYISVLERTQQIGLMKALGMRRRDVGRLFKLEAAWIGFLGGIIGSGVAVVAGTVANPAISKAVGIGDTHLLIFDPMQVAIVVIGLVLVSVGAGILPARKAAKLDPIEALRTE